MVIVMDKAFLSTVHLKMSVIYKRRTLVTEGAGIRIKVCSGCKR